MKAPTFASIYALPGSRDIRYDHVRQMRYFSYARCLHIWEDDVVDLTRSFNGDTARQHIDCRLNISVVSSNELPTDRYDFLLPDGRPVKKADFAADAGQQAMLLIDWDHMVAVDLTTGSSVVSRGRFYRADYKADQDEPRVVRWVLPTALPLPATDISVSVLDREKARQARPYMAELKTATTAVLRLMDMRLRLPNSTGVTRTSELVRHHTPVAELLQALPEEPVERAAHLHWINTYLDGRAKVDMLRTNIAATYLNVVSTKRKS